MSAVLTPADIDLFAQFLENCLSQPENSAHRELCDRVMGTLRQQSELSQSDIGFLTSWLKAQELIVAGLQVLEMADEANADAIRHERECTETAFKLLPVLVNEARPGPDTPLRS